MSTHPQVTVVIRTYNRENTVGRAIESALNQDWPEKRVLVIDDGSSDGTRQLVETQYPTAVYHYQENQGLQGARLKGLALSTGEFIAYLDSDDAWDPRFLSASITAIQAHGAAFSIGNYQRINMYEGGATTSNLEVVPALQALIADRAGTVHPLDPATVRELFVCYLPAPTSTMVMRRGLVQEPWKGKALIADDWMMVLQMITRHQVGAVLLSEPLMHKYCLPDSISDGQLGRLWEMEWRANDFGVAYANYGSELTPAERRDWIREIAEHNFSLGYHFSRENDPARALKHYRAAFAVKPSPKLAAIIAKTAFQRAFR